MVGVARLRAGGQADRRAGERARLFAREGAAGAHVCGCGGARALSCLRWEARCQREEREVRGFLVEHSEGHGYSSWMNWKALDREILALGVRHLESPRRLYDGVE